MTKKVIAFLTMLKTQRLTLIPMESQHIQAFFDSRNALAASINADVTKQWPWQETKHILKWMQQKLHEKPDLCGWLGWFIIKTNENILIGDAGFAGKPDRFAAVSLGYNILPDYQRQGFGFEAAQKLTTWAFENESVTTVSAQTVPGSVASIRILEKLGMHKTAATKNIINWEVEKKFFLTFTSGGENNGTHTDFNCNSIKHGPYNNHGNRTDNKTTESI